MSNWEVDQVLTVGFQVQSGTGGQMELVSASGVPVRFNPYLIYIRCLYIGEYEMLDIAANSDQLPDLETYLEQASACELARRSILGAPVYTVISLIVLAGTPMLMDYGWW